MKTFHVFRAWASLHAFRVPKGFRAFSCSAEGHRKGRRRFRRNRPTKPRVETTAPGTKHPVPGTLPSVSAEGRFRVFSDQFPPAVGERRMEDAKPRPFGEAGTGASPLGVSSPLLHAAPRRGRPVKADTGSRLRARAIPPAEQNRDIQTPQDRSPSRRQAASCGSPNGRRPRRTRPRERTNG